MRINQFISQSTGLSRRKADLLISSNEILVNKQPAVIGQNVTPNDLVEYKHKILKLPEKHSLIMLNKPVGYIVSKNGQGQKTIYDILPKKYYSLKPIGRLDKDSSGIILLTDDGQLALNLTHPKFLKEKTYLVQVDKKISSIDLDRLNNGIEIDSGISKLKISYLKKPFNYKIVIHEGKNRQIRKSLAKLNYQVINLHRIKFGEYNLGLLKPGEVKEINYE